MSDDVSAPLSQWDGGREEASSLQHQNAELRNRLTSLIDAIRRISGTLHTGTVLERVVESARTLTNARYGVLLTYDEDGGVRDVFTSGMTPEERSSLEHQPRGAGLPEYLNETQGPLRLGDISGHPALTGFPENHPPANTFLGMQIRNDVEHVGNIFLTERKFGQEFTEVDEETIVMLVSLAAIAITNARTHENERRARADLEALLDISPVAVSVFDAKTGHMVSCNAEFMRIAGNPETLRTGWEDAIPTWSFRRADGREIPLSELPLNRVFLFGETVRAEDIIVVLPDGRSIPTLVSAAPVYSEEGELTAAVVASQDLTPLVDLERVRAEFLGLISEELRMPLTTIKGAIASLSDFAVSHGPSEGSQLLRIIDQQTDLMHSQINSLVELSYIDTGTLVVSPKSTDLRPLVDDARRDFLRGHQGSEIQMANLDGVPPVLADRQRIGQVLSNLLYSVSRHTTDLSSLRISASQMDIYVAISVSASSEAISAGEPRQLVQEILGSQIQDIRRVAGGETLALAMCKGIVEAHGGRLSMEGQDQTGGVAFTFTLPVAPQPLVAAPEEEAGPSHSKDSEWSELARSEGGRILVATEDTRLMGTIRRTLSRAGHSPIPASDFSALDRTVYEENPDLLLLDLSSRAAVGLELTQHLSSNYGVPVIVLSGQADSEDIVRAFGMGADDYIVKPFSPTELVARTAASLRKRSAVRLAGSPHRYLCGNVEIDYAGHTVTVSGSPVHMTATEYDLLVELATNAGRILTQDELLHRVWGPEYTGESQLLRSYVRSLRQKLGDSARSPSYIFTEHGIGYRMQRP